MKLYFIEGVFQRNEKSFVVTNNAIDLNKWCKLIHYTVMAGPNKLD